MSYERSNGHSTQYDVVEFGYNYRIDDIRAAIGVVQLDKIQTDLLKRAEIRKWYIDSLKDIPQILIPFENYTEFSSNYIFPIILIDSNMEKRDSIRDKLAESGIKPVYTILRFIVSLYTKPFIQFYRKRIMLRII